MRQKKILVIKLSALGDFILALGAMEAIRRHHKDAHITLLTTKPFLDLAQKSGYFDEIRIDRRPPFYDIPEWAGLYGFFNGGGFSRVYDLQLNDRTSLYYRLFGRKPEWSGVVKGASLFYSNPAWRAMHAFERHREILKVAGIEVSLPDISWMETDVSFIAPKKPYVLLIPGSAPSRPDKRWSALKYGALGVRLVREGYQVAVLGTDSERDVISRIMKACPGVCDLSGRTSLYDIVSLARGAAGAVGNDTGPTHLVSLAGCPTVALFSSASDPEQSAPLGPVGIIQADHLDDVSVDRVFKFLKLRGAA